VKKKIIYTIWMCSLFFGLTNVKAASSCSYDEQAKLNGEVANIKASYEEATGVVDSSLYTVPDDIVGTDKEKDYQLNYYYLKVNMLNITDKFYIKMTNSQNSDEVTIKNSDTKDGAYTFDWKNVDAVTTLTFTVYSTDKTGCANEVYRIFYLTLPRYNDYSEYDLCSNHQNSSLCQRFVTIDEISMDDFLNQVSPVDKNGVSQYGSLKWYEKIGKFVTENKWWFIGGGVAIAGVVTYIVIRRKRSK
jgi:hypothetical protein